MIVSISVLQGERSEMLGKLLGRRGASFDFDLSSVAKKSEGFVANDLQALTARALHARALRDVSSDDDVTLEDFERAFDGFTPSSLAKVELHQASDVSWSDVGGLHDVRRTLTETLMWPTKVCTK